MILMPLSCNSFLFQKLDTDFDGAVSIIDFSKCKVCMAFAVQTIFLHFNELYVDIVYLLALRQPSYDPVRALTV